MTTRYVQARQVTAVVPNAGTVSQSIKNEMARAGSIKFPAALTGTTVNYEVTDDGTNYVALRVAAGTAFANITYAANQVQPLPAELFSFFAWRVVVAAQGAARSFVVNLY